MTNPETKLVMQFTALVTRASLEQKTQGTETFLSQESEENVSRLTRMNGLSSQGLQACLLPGCSLLDRLHRLEAQAAVLTMHGMGRAAGQEWLQERSYEAAEHRLLGFKQALF